MACNLRPDVLVCADEPLPVKWTVDAFRELTEQSVFLEAATSLALADANGQTAGFLLDTQTCGWTDRREGPLLTLTADFTSKLPKERWRDRKKKKKRGK